MAFLKRIGPTHCCRFLSFLHRRRWDPGIMKGSSPVVQSVRESMRKRLSYFKNKRGISSLNLHNLVTHLWKCVTRWVQMMNHNEQTLVLLQLVGTSPCGFKRHFPMLTQMVLHLLRLGNWTMYACEWIPTSCASESHFDSNLMSVWRYACIYMYESVCACLDTDMYMHAHIHGTHICIPMHTHIWVYLSILWNNLIMDLYCRWKERCCQSPRDCRNCKRNGAKHVEPFILTAAVVLRWIYRSSLPLHPVKSQEAIPVDARYMIFFYLLILSVMSTFRV